MRKRVASSDWWASRKVVSVISRRSCARIHVANPAGPSSRSRSRLPVGSSGRGVTAGMWGTGVWVGTGRSTASGFPFTRTSAMNESSRVARSRRGRKRKSSGVSSTKRVVYSPARNDRWAMRASRNGRLVFTPRMRNSRSARSIRRVHSSWLGAQAVTFSSSES